MVVFIPPQPRGGLLDSVFIAHKHRAVARSPSLRRPSTRAGYPCSAHRTREVARCPNNAPRYPAEPSTGPWPQHCGSGRTPGARIRRSSNRSPLDYASRSGTNPEINHRPALFEPSCAPQRVRPRGFHHARTRAAPGDHRSRKERHATARRTGLRMPNRTLDPHPNARTQIIPRALLLPGKAALPARHPPRRRPGRRPPAKRPRGMPLDRNEGHRQPGVRMRTGAVDRPATDSNRPPRAAHRTRNRRRLPGIVSENPGLGRR